MQDGGMPVEPFASPDTQEMGIPELGAPEAGVRGLDTPEQRKARGAFFTPAAIAEFIARWGIREGSELVMEPSCGEAAFLVAAARRLRSLGVPLDPGSAAGRQLHGVELHADSAAAARAAVVAEGVHASIEEGDFFLTEPVPAFDAVIGNPPYVRYQSFSGDSRARSRAAALRAGVNLTALASSWAAFTVHSALFLKRGGRLGLVLPAELLSVNYAAQVRRFLLERFREVSIVLFEERVFPGVLEEVVLLLADGYDEGAAEHASVFQVRNPDELTEKLSGYRWTPPTREAKWTPSLLGDVAHDAYAGALVDGSFTDLLAWGDTTLGMVTGNNRYFTLSPQRAAELGLQRSDVLRLAPPGSKHLRSIRFGPAAWRDLGDAGAATCLFRPRGTPSAAADEYIRAGEAAGVHLAYKCRVRKPWWRVPLVPVADVLVTYMNSDAPRLASNSAKVHHLNSVHGLYLKPELKPLGVAGLPLATLNSVTLLGAEVVGRSYGGGMLKLEPREADALPVPSPELIERSLSDLRSAERGIRNRMAVEGLPGAAVIVDEILRRHGFDVPDGQLRQMRDARAQLVARRFARGPEPGQG